LDTPWICDGVHDTMTVTRYVEVPPWKYVGYVEIV
jgi:hypothetical protein